MKVEELRAIAKEKKMPGAWKAKKSELIAWLEAQELQNEPELTETTEANKILTKEEEASEQPSNGWELIAKTQLKNAYDQVVGEYENSLLDGEITQKEFDRWIGEEALEEVYHEAITTKYHEDACGGPAPTEMRFAGKEFCYEYLARLFKNDGYKLQIESCGTLEVELNKSSAKEESVSEQPQNAPKSKLKGYAAWVVDRETKKITSVLSKAESREDFYNSIKDKYRVRLITKPEKLEEECKQWEIKHARNKQKKNKKYAADRIEAQKMKMNVAEYRKYLRESAKTGK